jgi:hypothetical protein
LVYLNPTMAVNTSAAETVCVFQSTDKLSAAGVCVIADPIGTVLMQLDGEKGFVKDEDILSGAEHRSGVSTFSKLGRRR